MQKIPPQKPPEPGVEVEEILGENSREFCLDCAMAPCLCILVKIEKRILELQKEERIPNKVEEDLGENKEVEEVVQGGDEEKEKNKEVQKSKTPLLEMMKKSKETRKDMKKKETPGKNKRTKKKTEQEREKEREEGEDMKKMKKLLENWRKNPGEKRKQAAQVSKDMTVNVEHIQEVTVEVVEEETLVTKARRRFSTVVEDVNDYETWKRKRSEKRKLEDGGSEDEVKRKACRESDMVHSNIFVETNRFCYSEKGGGQVQEPETGTASLDRVGDDRPGTRDNQYAGSGGNIRKHLQGGGQVQTPETVPARLDRVGDDRSGTGDNQYARSGGNIRKYLQAKKRTAQLGGKTGSGGTT